MAYTINDIKTRALALLGGGERDGEKLSLLCAAAASELESRLREGVSSAGIEESFITAAGILALSMYAELSVADGTSGVRAGSVTVSRGGRTEISAAALRREAEAMLAAYLRDRGFDFRGVAG